MIRFVKAWFKLFWIGFFSVCIFVMNVLMLISINETIPFLIILAITIFITAPSVIYLLIIEIASFIRVVDQLLFEDKIYHEQVSNNQDD